MTYRDLPLHTVTHHQVRGLGVDSFGQTLHTVTHRCTPSGAWPWRRQLRADGRSHRSISPLRHRRGRDCRCGAALISNGSGLRSRSQSLTGTVIRVRLETSVLCTQILYGRSLPSTVSLSQHTALPAESTWRIASGPGPPPAFRFPPTRPRSRCAPSRQRLSPMWERDAPCSEGAGTEGGGRFESFSQMR